MSSLDSSRTHISIKRGRNGEREGRCAICLIECWWRTITKWSIGLALVASLIIMPHSFCYFFIDKETKYYNTTKNRVSRTRETLTKNMLEKRWVFDLVVPIWKVEIIKGAMTWFIILMMVHQCQTYRSFRDSLSSTFNHTLIKELITDTFIRAFHTPSNLLCDLVKLSLYPTYWKSKIQNCSQVQSFRWRL